MDQAENPVGDGVIGIEFDGLLELCEGFVVAAGGVVGPADGDVDDERERIERLAVFHLGDGFCVAAHGHRVFGVPVIGGGVGGIEFEAALEFFLQLLASANRKARALLRAACELRRAQDRIGEPLTRRLWL